MSNPHLISIIIPCYNGEQFIAECIDSALAQTWPNKEVIVVDDCSTDGSLKILKSYGDRIQLYSGEKYGAPEARNFGASQSNGEFLQFFDADDLMLPEKISRQVERLRQSDADFSTCQCQGFGEGIPLHDGPKVTRVPDSSDPYTYVKQNVFLQTGNPLHRREIFEKVGGFSNYAFGTEDPELILKMMAAGARYELVDEPLYRIRHHQSPSRVGQRKKNPGDQMRVWSDHARYLLQAPATYRLTPAAKHALGSHIHQSAIYAYRGGVETSQVSEAFALAKSLTPNPDYQERSVFKLAAKIVSPLNAERALSLVRRAVRGKRFQD